MFKIIFTIKRRSGMSRQQFIDYYEGNHTVLVRASRIPRAPLYRRNYIIDGVQIAGISAVNSDESSFDSLTEIGFATREDAEAHIAAYLDPSNYTTIAADEANFIEPGSLHFYIMEVYQSEGDEPEVTRNAWVPSPPTAATSPFKSLVDH